MPNLQADDRAMYNVLAHAQVIAVVGHSDRPDRASYRIARFLRDVGYTVYPVNPALQEIDGEPVYPTLLEVPQPVDIVNVFRRSEFLPAVIDEAISLWERDKISSKTVWAQVGVVNPLASQKALAAGLNIVMDACIKIEYLRLGVTLETPPKQVEHERFYEFCLSF